MYKNNQLPLLWYCKEGHLWQASLEIVTKYLGLPSENHRLDFLKIPKHPKGLGLDIYYPEYGFAIEATSKINVKTHASAIINKIKTSNVKTIQITNIQNIYVDHFSTIPHCLQEHLRFFLNDAIVTVSPVW
ncbi:hypothetical protein Glove_319g44 [Diversispora epigaea]|uniref:Uncharacterized protein n=1 Tax=Diversispora epigaea TaxID=1348612 RepID=A0A397HPK0_9GLOM|nr:hypothetical protein Glove_319g44 [Diversispora epigaea]